MAGELLSQSYEHIACLAAVLRQPCVFCGCRTSFRKRKQIARKMNMSKIRCGSLATLFFVRQSSSVVHNTVRLLYETKKFVVADGCTAAAIYCGANLNTWSINIKENQHKGAQFIQYGPKTAMTGTHFYSTHRLQTVEKRRTCDVNVIFKNSVNLACLPIIADLYRRN